MPELAILLPRTVIPTTRSVALPVKTTPFASLDPPETESKTLTNCFAIVKVNIVPLAEELVPLVNWILKPLGPSGKLPMRRELEPGLVLSE